MRPALLSVALSCLAALGAALPVQADVLDVAGPAGTGPAAAEPLPTFSWGRLQGRLAFASTATPLRSGLQGADAAFRVSSLSLMGDYYLRPSLSQLTLGGLRATGGLLLGPRNGLWGQSSSRIAGLGAERRSLGGAEHFGPGTDHEHTATPYVGIGYSGTGALFGRSSHWGFSADLGLMSLSPGALGRTGRVVSGSQNLDDMVRDLRLSPVLQFGFSYAF